MESPGLPDEALTSCVEGLRKPGEVIWDCRRLKNGNVHVLLIDSRDIEHAERMIAFGLAGGEGRCFEFEQVDGRWSLIGQGRWIG